jgi:Protein of unknown function (DUF2971)
VRLEVLGGSRERGCRFLFADRKERDADATGLADLVIDRSLYAADCTCSFFYLSKRKLANEMHMKVSNPAPDSLFHYTDQKGLLGIITSGSLWATQIRYSNDADEFLYTLDMVRSETEELEIAADSEDISLLAQMRRLTNELNWQITDHISNYFVLSFSSRPDQWSQWHKYCSGGNGYSIGFKSSSILPLTKKGFTIKECIYDESSQKRKIQNSLLQLLSRFRTIQSEHAFNLDDPGIMHEQTRAFEEKFIPIATIFKHPKFFKENEWRVISPSIEYDDSTIQHREGKSMIVPYLSVNLTNGSDPLELAEIIVGPTAPNESELTYFSAESMIRSHHISCNVKHSQYTKRLSRFA